MADPNDPRPPLTSLLFGYGPMLPLLAAGLGVWVLPEAWAVRAIRAAILWGALILVFIAGVRRGFGFGAPAASIRVEIATMLAYFLLGLAALAAPSPDLALALLMIGYALAALLDRRGAIAGNAPRHFARLRPPQLLLGALGLAAAFARSVV